jgi:hypothetical protein
MTLLEFFNFLGDNPVYVLAYFIGIPFAAFLAGILGKGEGHITPWREFYSLLIYLVCVPGILATALSVYFFLFERGSIMNSNVLVQILPILSMIITLILIRKNVEFAYIPGFDKMSTLVMMICAVFVVMYLLDRAHIFIWINLPVFYFVGMLIGLLLLFRWGMKRIVN